MSLLIDSCIFSILLSRFLIIFTLIFLNSFSGSLPISSSFIWTSVFLVCSSISVVFLCLFAIFLNLLCLRSPFPRLQCWILSSFRFLPSKVGPVVCISVLEGESCAEFLSVCLFFLWWAGLSEMVVLSDGLGLCFCFVCCLDELSCTGCYWWLGDVGSCITVVSCMWVFTIWYLLELVLW